MSIRFQADNDLKRIIVDATLRRELGVLPPGDLRMALTALAAPDGDAGRWREVFAHRFGGTGALAGHAVGNLVMAGLLEMLGRWNVARTKMCSAR